MKNNKHNREFTTKVIFAVAYLDLALDVFEDCLNKRKGFFIKGNIIKIGKRFCSMIREKLDGFLDNVCADDTHTYDQISHLRHVIKDRQYELIDGFNKEIEQIELKEAS